MYRSCINHSAVINYGNVEEQMKVLHDAGFKCIDFNIDIFLKSNEISSGEFNDFFRRDISQILEDIRPYKESCEKYGIEITQAHAPYQLYVDGNEKANEFCYEIVKKCIEICAYLNCGFLVVHPLNLAYLHDRDYEQKINLEYYKRFIDSAKKYNVVICLENMFATVNRHITEAVCSDCYQAAKYIDELNEFAGGEYFGFCFDLGHMNLLGKHIKESLKVLGKRIKLLHIHDNDGIQDNHGIPYSYARNWGQSPVTDWKGFLEGLKEIGYKGEFDFECSTGCRLVPNELLLASLTYVNEIGKYFAKQMSE